MNLYTVAQNKPDYLLLLCTFCISTTKHVSMITYEQLFDKIQHNKHHLLHYLLRPPSAAS